MMYKFDAKAVRLGGWLKSVPTLLFEVSTEV